MLDDIPARRKVVFIDACHSGEIDEDESLKLVPMKDYIGTTETPKGVSGLKSRRSGKATSQSSFEVMQELFADISYSNGAVIISAAGGKEYAYEGRDWNNGVFTHTLIDAIDRGSADLNRDQQTTISELRFHVYREVLRLTGGRQKPTSRQENLVHDFIVW